MKKNILSLLKKYIAGLGFEDIQSELKLKRRDKNKLRSLLRELEKDKLIRRSRNRFSLSPETGIIRGRFVTSGRGFGFVAPEGGGEDIFVPARFADGVFQGDEVEVLVKKSGKFGKPEGRVGRILRRGRSTILGIYKERSGSPFIQAFESPTPEDIPLKSRGRLSPIPGMIVEADRKALGIVRIFGWPDDPGVDTQVIIRRFNLASKFSGETLAEAEEISAEIAPGDLEGRRDFRDWTTVTIDGDKAQDFDDAVSIKLLENGRYLLAVHIADVSHYVRPGTALDREAGERGTSVYFPDLTLPMLPEVLSNNLCSLRPRQLRLTVSVLMEIDGQGEVVRAEFTPSLIQTVERMTYTSVFRIFEGDEAERKKYAPLLDDFQKMRELSRILRTRRLEEGSLDFDLAEPELLYQSGKLHAIEAAERNEAHRIVEEFMVAANVAVASFLGKKEIPAILRIHPRPSPAELEKLRILLMHFGFVLPEAKKIKSADLQRVLAASEGRSEAKLIGIRILRAMKLAVYSEENVGHYGLAKNDYTHFTSPIRRYPDLVVHRILKAVLGKLKPDEIPLAAVALHASERERNAADAEKALLGWRIFRFLKDHLGEEFMGTIVDITKAGLFVELDDYFVGGLLPYQALGGDYYARANAKTLRGRKGGKRYDMGDRIRVILASCDPALQRMSFALEPGVEKIPS